MSSSGLLIIAGLLLLFVDAQSRERIPVSSIISKNIKLKCDLPMSDPPQIEWVDYVNNEDHNPETIFKSIDNPEFRIHRRHPQWRKYSVSKDYSLTIKMPTVEKDPGEYVCQSKVDGETFIRSYYLTVGDIPKCEGKTELLEGEDTKLSCSSPYSGNQPSLKWLREGDEVNSDDQFDIRLARRAFSVKVSRKDDKTKYVCRFEMGDVVEECSLTLSVQHLVKHLAFDPEKERYYVKDTIRCVADGNPEPEITLTPKLANEQTGSGYKALTVPEEWRGTKQFLSCVASNKLNDATEVRVINKTVFIREEENPANLQDSFTAVNSIAIVAGIIVGVLLLVIIIVAVMCMRLRKAKSAQKDNKKLFEKEDGKEKDKNGKV